jgi:catechol 2,3-dioxygenase-like lactoylglutathione lyase family enzyme
MLDHVGLEVRDIEASKAFYGKALAPLGIELLMEPVPNAAGFGSEGKPYFWVASRGTPQTAVHVAFAAATRELVDDFYLAALAAGGRDNGPPGPRPIYHESYYGAFVLDPDGNNVEAVCHRPE